jgi:branched-chain amino acid transport system substrate-binding protein
MVKEYIAKYGGTPSDINADVAEAYAVGQVMAQAVKATNSLDNKKLIDYLHSGATFDSVLGPAKFDAKGANTVGQSLIFQWQNAKLVETLPAGAAGTTKPQYPKPNWH